jgi:hypothetical protein
MGNTGNFLKKNIISIIATALIVMIALSYYIYQKPRYYKIILTIKTKPFILEKNVFKIITRTDIKKLAENYINDNDSGVKTEGIEMSLLRLEEDEYITELNFLLKDTTGQQKLVDNFSIYLNKNIESNYLVANEREKNEEFLKIINHQIENLKKEIDNIKAATGKTGTAGYDIYYDYAKLQEKLVEVTYKLNYLKNLVMIKAEFPKIKQGLPKSKQLFLAGILSLFVGIFIVLTWNKLFINNEN